MMGRSYVKWGDGAEKEAPLRAEEACGRAPCSLLSAQTHHWRRRRRRRDAPAPRWLLPRVLRRCRGLVGTRVSLRLQQLICLRCQVNLIRGYKTRCAVHAPQHVRRHSEQHVARPGDKQRQGHRYRQARGVVERERDEQHHARYAKQDEQLQGQGKSTANTMSSMPRIEVRQHRASTLEHNCSKSRQVRWPSFNSSRSWPPRTSSGSPPGRLHCRQANARTRPTASCPA